MLLKGLKMESVFITGGAGLIGRQLAHALLKRGYSVRSFDLGEQIECHRDEIEDLKKLGAFTVIEGTIMDSAALRRHTKGVGVVVHLAAMLGVKRTEENRLGCIEININGTDNVLNACVLNKVKHVVFASSSEVYGEPNSNPITEEHETKGKTVYAVSKLAGEELVKGYNQLYPELQYTIVRFFNTYGEGQVAQFALSRFVEAVLEKRNPVVYGDGQQTRSYGHVEDVCKGLVSILEKSEARNQVFNLGNSSQVYTLLELAQLVIDLLAPNESLEVDILGDFEGSDRLPEREIYHRFCDISKAQKLLGYEPTISVSEGIRRIAERGIVQKHWPDGGVPR